MPMDIKKTPHLVHRTYYAHASIDFKSSSARETYASFLKAPMERIKYPTDASSVSVASYHKEC